MEITVLNAVACEKIRVGRRITLVDVGPRWSHPPSSLGLWIELSNPSERAFQVEVQIWRGKLMLDESPTELVLAGQAHWQAVFQWETMAEYERKTYTIVVLVDGLMSRTITVDFGAGTGP